MTAKGMGRRAALGALALSYPFLRLPFFRSASAVGVARAQSSTIRRVVFFIQPNGTTVDEFYPDGGAITNSHVLEPLTSFAEKLLVIRGLDNEAGKRSGLPNHDPDFPALMTGRRAGRGGTGSGISIDQHIANAVGDATPHRSLHLGVRAGGMGILYRSAGQAVGHENDPYALQDRIFTSADLGQDELERIRRRRGSVLDVVSQELASMRCEMLPEERALVDSHAEGIRRMEQALSDPRSLEPTCREPALGPRIDVEQERNFDIVARAQIDLLSASLACDLTRVATIQFSNAISGMRFSFEPLRFDSRYGLGHWHNDIHEQFFARRDFVDAEISRYFAGLFEYFCEGLASYPEGDGTVLDHTAIVWVHEHASTHSHTRDNIPIVIGGSLGGFLKNGQLIDAGGTPLNRLYLTLAHGMGLPDDHFGDDDIDSRPLSEIER